MGAEFTVDSLEDMCALMCDNRIPRKKGRMRREITSIDFGEWIKEKRRAKGLKQYELAKMIPMNPGTLSRYVTGEVAPPLDIAEKICELLGAELVIRETGNDRDFDE